MAYDQTSISFNLWPKYSGICGAVLTDTTQRLYGATSTDLVIVLSDDGFLGADIEPPKHGL